MDDGSDEFGWRDGKDEHKATREDIRFGDRGESGVGEGGVGEGGVGEGGVGEGGAGGSGAGGSGAGDKGG